jgi:arylsulfatase A-like enzyme
MIVRWTGKIEEGTTTDHISAFWDIMPTLAEIADVEVPDNIDGISILPSLLNIPGQKHHEFLYWEYHSQGGKQAVRQGNWKAVRLNCLDTSKTTIQLFDLEADPSEKKNIAGRHPEIIEVMEDIMNNESTYNEIFPFYH